MSNVFVCNGTEYITDSEESLNDFCNFLDKNYITPVCLKLNNVEAEEVFYNLVRLLSEDEIDLVSKFEQNDLKFNPIFSEQLKIFIVEKMLLDEK